MTSSGCPPVGIIIGHNIDDSAAPPTHERNRFVADMVLHYACQPFFRDSEEMAAVRAVVREANSTGTTAVLSAPIGKLPTPLAPAAISVPAHQSIATAAAAALTPKARLQRRLSAGLSASPVAATTGPGVSGVKKAASSVSSTLSVQLDQTLSIWKAEQPASDTFTWGAQRLPPVGAAELGEFHDRDFIKYLAVRETLSDIDERATLARRQLARTLQPVLSRRTSAAVGEGASSFFPTVAASSSKPQAPSSSATQPLSPLCVGNRSEARETTRVTEAVTGGRVQSSRSPPPLRELPDLIPIPQDEAYGLVQDAAPFLGLWRTVQATVAGTLAAVHWLLRKEEKVNTTNDSRSESGAPLSESGSRFAALHWFGGRHRAKADSAGGFCYANDVVLAALALRRGLPLDRNCILIVDLDAHHGDGTQEAFYSDNSCYTLSVHRKGAGLYPGTGAADECGCGLAEGYCANVPLPEGATDQLFVPLVRRAIRTAIRKLTGRGAVSPSVSVASNAARTPHHSSVSTSPAPVMPVPPCPVVADRDTSNRNPSNHSTSPSCLGGVIVVCGSDGVRGDPMGRMNYSIAGLQCVVRLLIEAAAEHDAKLLILGAGGYVNTTAARVAGVITRDVLSAATARRLGLPVADLFFLSPFLKDCRGVAVPDTCDYFTRYGPSFLMHGTPDPCVPRVRELTPDDPGYSAWQAITEKAKIGASAAVTPLGADSTGRM